MDGQDITLLVAFGAGVLSFASPCVLPLVPIFIGYLSGAAVGEESPSRLRTILHAIFFVLGFSAVFVALGASVGLLGYVVYRYVPIAEKVGGVILIVLGLHLMGVLKIPSLNMEKRISVREGGRSSYPASFVVGMVFALGWSPCVGPILSGILMLASASQTVGRGALLLGGYSLGLGLPFVGTAAALGLVSRWLKKLNRYMHAVSIVAGAFLAVMGILMLTGLFEQLNVYLMGFSIPT